MPNDTAARLHAIMTGQDGPAAPIADPSTYSWPTSADDATAERIARESIAAGLHHQRTANHIIERLGFMKATNDIRWIASQTAASYAADRAVLFLALVKADPELAKQVARDIWTTTDDGGAEASLNYAARAMGIPLPAEVSS